MHRVGGTEFMEARVGIGAQLWRAGIKDDTGLLTFLF
jgi:hypothetical protein